jgi:hypothetical protein
LLTIPTGANPACSLRFEQDPMSIFSLKSVIGDQTRIKNIPQASEYIMNQIKKLIKKEFVAPNGISFPIPIEGERPFDVTLIRKQREKQVKGSNLR